LICSTVSQFIILRLVNKGYEDVALKLLRLMPRGTRVNGEAVDVGAFFIRQLVKANRPVEKILTINCQRVHNVQQILVQQYDLLGLALGERCVQRIDIAVARKGAQQRRIGIRTGLQSRLLHHAKDALGRLQIVGLKAPNKYNNSDKSELEELTYLRVSEY